MNEMYGLRAASPDYFVEYGLFTSDSVSRVQASEDLRKDGRWFCTNAFQ